MNALVLTNFPIAILVILAIVGIPLWMTFKRPERTPDYAGAQAYLRGRTSRARTVTAVAGPARTGLTAVRQPAAARAAADRAAQPTRAAA